MTSLERFSEPYTATGGLAAVGVLNQLGRPDIEPLEVLVREAIQNCWDAKRDEVRHVRVEVGWSELDSSQLALLRDTVLVDPPPGLGLEATMRDGMRIMYFADFGTYGLSGPTRADRPGQPRDFVDFVRNIGQPPDKDFAGGSFGYGKAAFYIASEASTIIVDTLCELDDGTFERRLLGCALGDNFELGGIPHTGRHWWGRVVDGIPEPLVGPEAEAVAAALGLPSRSGSDGRGTTVLVVAPSVGLQAEDGSDCSMDFVADAILWNFWPRMIDTPGGAKHSLEFRLSKNGAALRIPDPRRHPRLRGFVEAMDRMHQAPGSDDDFVLDRPIKCLRPVQTLGRLVVQKGAISASSLPDRPVPVGASITSASVHHVALMRTPEIVVKYLQGPAAINGKFGYSGVFKCSLDTDGAFKAAEPPTHDDWVYKFVHNPQERSFVKIALERVLGVCRTAAGYENSVQDLSSVDGVPLGEFADALATLMPGADGLGARRQPSKVRKKNPARRRRKAPGRTDIDATNADVWVDGKLGEADSQTGASGGDDSTKRTGKTPIRPPQARPSGDPTPEIGFDGTPVIRYPFELRSRGHRVRLRASVEIMTNDGQQLEKEAPAGYTPPRISCWLSPDGARHTTDEPVTESEGADGRWLIDVELRDEMMRLEITPEIA